MNKPICCFLDCGKDAEWEFFDGPHLTYDNFLHACNDHLGHMLIADQVSTVYAVEKPVEMKSTGAPENPAFAAVT
jgi:hypothetical protein